MKPSDSPKPVAYDADGRPLYAHPPAAGEPETNDAQVVYMTRAIDPHRQEISEEVKAKHAESTRRYPSLNLSEGEYVISAVRRHPIGLLSIWALVIAAVLLVALVFVPLLINANQLLGIQLSAGAMVSGGIVLLLVVVLFVLGGIISTIVYDANRFYLTNESVIQHIQTGLFSRNDQTISLSNIEDASFRQRGILQTILNYGSIRLSTEGDETTYRFSFVAHPKREIDLLNNAVEAFKNFRPVDE